MAKALLSKNGRGGASVMTSSLGGRGGTQPNLAAMWSSKTLSGPSVASLSRTPSSRHPEGVLGHRKMMRIQMSLLTLFK